jgi:hypothetical protein
MGFTERTAHTLRFNTRRVGATRVHHVAGRRDGVATCGAGAAGAFEGDMAKEVGGANVSRVRSLRRTLLRLCELGVIQMLGIKRPHSYRLHPNYCPERTAHHPELIRLIYLIKRDDSQSDGVRAN